jgi:nucleoside-diphosphate-sugar epimerase
LSKRTVLLTGAAGFIGRSVCAQLEALGCDVLPVDVSSPAAGRCVACDISDRGRAEALFRGKPIDAVIHLAAILPTAARRDPDLAARVNIQGSFNLLELARDFAALRFVFASSLSVYGPVAAEEPVAESHPAVPDDLYGAAKLYIETLGESFARSSGLQFAALRISTVLGGGGRSPSSPWRSDLFEALAARQPQTLLLPYRAGEMLPLVHVHDVAAMLIVLLRANPPQHTVYNCVSESWRIQDLKRELEALNPRLRVEMGDRVAGIPKHIDDRRFQREFNYSATPLRQYFRRAAKGWNAEAI